MKPISCLLLAMFALSSARADEPILPSSSSNFCSPSHSFCASSSRKTNITTINPQQAGDKSWTLNEFVQAGLISDDGNWIASCYGGLNLVPADAGRDFLVAIVYGRDGFKREVKLGEVVANLDKLPITTSHKEWGLCRSVSRSGLKIERYDGSLIEIPLK